MNALDKRFIIVIIICKNFPLLKRLLEFGNKYNKNIFC